MALSNALRPTFYADFYVRDPFNSFVDATERSHKEANLEEYFEPKFKVLK